MKIFFTIVLMVLAFSSCEGEAGVVQSNNQNNTNNVNNINNTNNTTDLCPGGTDQDHDGYGEGCPLGADCNDLNPHINPGQEELCNTIDDNCNDIVDEGCSCTSGQMRVCSSYIDPRAVTYNMRCKPGYELCVDSEWSGVCVGETGPIPEICNGLDDDCDGDIDNGVLNAVGECGTVIPDEDCGPTGEGNGLDDNGDGQVDETCNCSVPGYDPDLPRTGQPCYSGPISTLGVGICHGGTRDCLPGGVWGTCTGQVIPMVETCGDGIDNDCDG
ncbi:putative metal-binding motif-containing protein, partial [Myxococcota bacterium]|nr:putative metal-binding motif-containing protein [Myxococcota bacterium]MBU1536791.1 putative metal-binding motif-containing protein [Myxococcota bacterium]